MRNSVKLTLSVALLGVFLATPAVWAGNLAGVTMAETTSLGDQELQLNGMALRSKAIFKVYVAGLYLPAPNSDAPAVLTEDGPRRLVMHWVRSVDKDKICEAWDEGLEANTPDADEQLKADFVKLCNAMTDAKTGNRFVFTYTPDAGTTIEIDGKLRGQIEGKAFADALFKCWIGPKPGPGEDFREALMGRS